MPLRSSRSGARFLEWRIALFALGAVVWLTGLLIENRAVTGAAIVIFLAAVVLGLAARRR